MSPASGRGLTSSGLVHNQCVVANTTAVCYGTIREGGMKKHNRTAQAVLRGTCPCGRCFHIDPIKEKMRFGRAVACIYKGNRRRIHFIINNGKTISYDSVKKKGKNE